ncbi:MAG: hypothetical protein Q9N26_03385, partial [Aquificota bacterium]|nr:hypothetical protein [Aquificota bacterium]
MGRKGLYILAAVLMAGVLLLSLDVYADRKAKETVNTLVERFGIEDRVSYGKVDHSVLKGETRIENLSFQVKDGVVSVDEVIVSELTDERTRVRFVGISSTDEDFGEFRRNMKDLGYEDVKVNLFLDVRTDREKGDLQVRSLEVEVPGAFSLSMSLDLGNLSYSFLEKIDEEDLPEITEKVGRIRIRSLEVSLTDLGLRERAIRREAMKTGKTPERVKEEILRDLEMSVSESDPEIKKDLVKNLKTFIDEGGTIRITARPETPVSL